MNKILIIVGHPDDEVLGCGGSIAKWSREGDEVHILIMAEGATSRMEKRSRLKAKRELKILSEAAERAAEILGATSVKLLSFPDNRMDSLDRLDIVKKLERYIFDIKPDILVTHHIGDVNIDHQVIHHAAVVACRPMPNRRITLMSSAGLRRHVATRRTEPGPRRRRR